MAVIDIIVNPASGAGAARSCLTAVTNYLIGKNIEYAVHTTNERGAAASLAQKLCASGAKTVAVIGGDGTFHEALNGMDFSRARIGFIPAGRGNDYAAGVGLPFDPIKAAAAIIKNESFDADYIQVGNRRCLNVCGTGLDVDVLRLTADSGNKLSYVASLFARLLHYKPYNIQIEINGVLADYSCVMAGVCNGSQIGGGIRLCPCAKADDGLLDVIIMEKPKNAPTIFAMPGFVRGKHMKKSYTKHFRCERVKIVSEQRVQLDGEIYDDRVIDAAVVKGGLRTFKSGSFGAAAANP